MEAPGGNRPQYANQRDSHVRIIHTRRLVVNERIVIGLESEAHFYELTADQGSAGGQLNDGFCLLNGRGVDLDLSLAAHYFKLAADQGHDCGQFTQGFCLLNGRGIDLDLRLAAHYFKLAADQECAGGQLKYGVCLETRR
jgi:TPR repeat protein